MKTVQIMKNMFCKMSHENRIPDNMIITFKKLTNKIVLCG